MSARSAQDLSPATLHAVQAWLESLGPQEGSTLAETLGVEDDEHDELGDLSEAVAVAPDGTRWSLVVPVAAIEADESKGNVIIIPTLGDAMDSNWSVLADDPDWWLQRDARLVGDTVDVWQIPFRLDSDAWVDAEYDEIYGEGDCTLSINWSDDQLRIGDLLAYREPNRHGGPATIVDVACEGSSMTTGDIGAGVRQDPDGGCWYELWGCTSIFLGRPADEADRHAMAWRALGESLNSVGRIKSNVLSPQEMRDLLESVEGYDPNFTPEAIEITCPGFTGTAEELIELIPEASA